MPDLFVNNEIGVFDARKFVFVFLAKLHIKQTS